MIADVLHRRLVFVTGKGGVGKSAVTLALAVAAARAKRRVLVVEVNPYGRIGEYVGGRTLGPEPVEVAPRVEAAAIVPAVVLEEFVHGILRIRALTRRLLESHTFRVVTAAAPGLEDFLTLVRIAKWEGARAGLRRGRHRYDLVIVDAPATGHSLPLLGTPGSLLKMLAFGPLAGAARDLALLLGDRDRTAVAIIARAEEMVVNETLELAGALLKLGVEILPPVVNAVPPLRFTAAEARRLRADQLDLPPALLPYAAAGQFSLARQRASERQIRRLARALGRKPFTLPQVPARRFGWSEVEQLADDLVAPPPRRSASAGRG